MNYYKSVTFTNFMIIFVVFFGLIFTKNPLAILGLVSLRHICCYCDDEDEEKNEDKEK